MTMFYFSLANIGEHLFSYVSFAILYHKNIKKTRLVTAFGRWYIMCYREREKENLRGWRDAFG